MTAAILALVAALSALASPAASASLADYPRGEPARVGYVDHGTWRGPSGRTVDVPDRHGISAITPYDGGFFISDTRYFEGSIGLVRVDAVGRVVGEWAWASSGSAVVGPDGSVAWTSFVPLESGEAGRSLVHRIDRCGRETVQEWPDRAPFSVAGFIDEQVVVDGAFQLPVELLDPSGARTTLGLAGASDVSGPLVAGNLDPDGFRGGVVDARDGELLWRVRGSVRSFSPSGRRVVVSDPRGRDWWVARASDGHRLWQLDLPGRSGSSSPVWEDERHLLATVTLRGQTAILRFGRGGQVERVTDVARSDGSRPPFVLTSR